MVRDDLVYYSVNSTLAYKINEKFYHNHYVWCAPIFDPETLDSYHKYKDIPPSSAPAKIYKTYKEDVLGSDLHSAKIMANRSGLITGATLQQKKGLITDVELAIIISMVNSATIDKFKPLLYIIPGEKVQKKLIEVPVDKMANPLSVEFQIHDLVKSEFDILEF